jgi:hypothetical protein
MEGCTWPVEWPSSEGEPLRAAELGAHPADGPPAFPAPRPDPIAPAPDQERHTEQRNGPRPEIAHWLTPLPGGVPRTRWGNVGH